MESKSYSKINLILICVIFITSILNIYEYFMWTPYLLIVLLLGSSFFNVLIGNINLSSKEIFLLSITILIVFFNILRGRPAVGIVSYIIPVTFIIFMKQICSAYGVKFYNNLLGYLSFFINLLAILNVYQIFFRRPFLYSFLSEVSKSYQFIGMDYYRTSSIFGNAIPACQIFVVGFFLNLLIKKKFWYVLNCIILWDIYSTQSRSGWISLFVGIVFYYLFRLKKINLRNLSFNLSQFISFCIVSSITSIAILLNYRTILIEITRRFGDSLSIQNSTDISNLQRVLTFKSVTFQMFNSNIAKLLFGNGTGRSRDFMRENKMVITNFNTMDNQILSSFYDLGIVVILIITFILILYIVKAYKNKDIMIAFSVIILVALTTGLFFYEGFNWPIISILWGLFIVGGSLNNNQGDLNE